MSSERECSAFVNKHGVHKVNVMIYSVIIYDIVMVSCLCSGLCVLLFSI